MSLQRPPGGRLAPLLARAASTSSWPASVLSPAPSVPVPVLPRGEPRRDAQRTPLSFKSTNTSWKRVLGLGLSSTLRLRRPLRLHGPCTPRRMSQDGIYSPLHPLGLLQGPEYSGRSNSRNTYALQLLVISRDVRCRVSAGRLPSCVWRGWGVCSL